MSRRFILIALLAPLVIPPVAFLVCASAAGMAPGESVRALAEQCAGHRQNPLLSGVLGIVPIGLLFLALRIARSVGKGRFPAEPVAWGGLAGVLVVLVWVQFEFWPKFLPARVYPGFPHGLEFVIGPIAFAPVAMLAGMAAAWITASRPS